MTVAFIGALLLLFGSLKVFVWMNHRLLLRQHNYNVTRVRAANSNTRVMWDEPSERLQIFQ